MTSLREELKRAADNAPLPDRVSDAGELWSKARRANRLSLLTTATLVIVAVLLGGLGIQAVVHDDTARPVDQPEQLGFPKDLYDVPSRTPTIEDAGPVGPFAVVGIAEHKGFWPWSTKESWLYGISATSGEYRFIAPAATRSEAFLDGGTWAVSPDGSRVAYAVDGQGPLAAGIDVLDTVTGEIDSLDLSDVDRDGQPDEFGFALNWMVFSPDSSRLAYAPWIVTSRRADGFSTSAHGYYTVDLAHDETPVWVDSNELANQSVTWKPAGSASPEGLAYVGTKNVVIVDPDTAQPRAKYRLGSDSSLQVTPMWNPDGDTYVSESQCDGQDCGYSIVRSTIDGSAMRIEHTTIATQSGDDLFRPIGWMGRTADADILAFGPKSPPYTLQVVTGSDMSEQRTLSASFISMESTVGADAIVADGQLNDAPAPRWPWGWPLLIPLLVMSLYVIRFVWGVRAMGEVRPPTATWSDVLQAVWRHDGVAVLSLIPALAIAAGLVVRHIGWFDPGYMIVVILLTWWTFNRSWGGYNLLTVVVIVYTLTTAIWRADGWPDIALVCLIGLAQLACLTAKGVFEYLRFGRGQGPTSGFGAGFSSPPAVGLWSQAFGSAPVSGDGGGQ